MKTITIILFAALFYCIIVPFFFHPDIKTIYYLTSFLGDGILNIYSFVASTPEAQNLGPFVYPPLAYYIFGILSIPITILAGSNFSSWLGMGNTAVEVTEIYRYLFLMKLPMVVVMLATGYILALLENKNKKAVLILWFFNPVSIYVIGFMGQFDILPVFLTVVALYYAKKRPWLAAVFLGLGAGLKTYPILLLPLLALLAETTIRKRIQIIIAGLIPFILIIAPFLKSSAFYSDTLVSGLSQRIFELELPIGFGEAILVIPALYLGLVIVAATKSSGTVRHLPVYFMGVCLLIVAGVHFHPQWVMWGLSFVVVLLANYKLWIPGILFFAGWLGVVILYQDLFLIWGLMSPLDADVYNLTTPFRFISNYFDAVLLQSLSHTVFVVSSAWIFWKGVANLND